MMVALLSQEVPMENVVVYFVCEENFCLSYGGETPMREARAEARNKFECEIIGTVEKCEVEIKGHIK